MVNLMIFNTSVHKQIEPTAALASALMKDKLTSRKEENKQKQKSGITLMWSHYVRIFETTRFVVGVGDFEGVQGSILGFGRLKSLYRQLIWKRRFEICEMKSGLGFADLGIGFTTGKEEKL
ncbi:Hypothetical predicted protein, partial [Olea europaea subsp. europaea]